MFRRMVINLFILLFFSTQASAQAAKNLGRKPDGFGSSAQALALIDLIALNPNHSTYQIAYKTSTDVVVFECDFNRDIITRTSKKSKGRSTIEQWSGQASERLRHAANGGSLDDTPKGHIPGTIRYF